MQAWRFWVNRNNKFAKPATHKLKFGELIADGEVQVSLTLCNLSQAI